MSASTRGERVLFTGTLTLPAGATWWSSVWGAASVTNGSPNVGGGSNFTTRISAGQTVSFANQPGVAYTVSSVTNNANLVLTTNFTGATNAATAIGFPGNPPFDVDGEVRIKGAVFSSVAPAAAFQIQLSQDRTNWDTVRTPTLDVGSVNNYSFDINLVGQDFARLVMTDAGAGSTVRILLYTSDFGGDGPDVIGGTSPAPAPTPTALPATYRLGFDGIVFSSAGGNFLELSNPAASGRVLRVTLQQLVKPSVPITWRIRKQSTVDAGGASTTPTPVPLDSNNAATVGIVKLYTVVPATPGTIVGTIWDQTVTGGEIVEDDPGISGTLAQPIVIRAGESVTWNASVAFTFQGAIEFTDAAA